MAGAARGSRDAAAARTESGGAAAFPGLTELMKSHTVRRRGRSFELALNKPEDFIFDVSEILFRYEPALKAYRIVCAELPREIITAMEAYQGTATDILVEFLEENLNCFCAGQCPADGPVSAETAEEAVESVLEAPSAVRGATTSEDAPVASPSSAPPLKRLPNYQFPTNTATPNIRFSAFKRGVLLFACAHPCFSVACKRCQRPASFEFSADAVQQLCGGCGAVLKGCYVPLCASERLGFLGLQDVTFIAAAPVHYQLSCAECEAVYETRLLGLGERLTARCACGSAIQVEVEAVEYLERSSHTAPPKIGQELPGRGACKHYKKSLRWFRFPCCQRLYPCDICHDEQAGHAHEQANRMVCGLCSREQSVRPSCECGMALKQRKSQFWEGGKGLRDKTTMSRRDSRKYTR